ncbi:MAG: TVP38/TMEM64 family protein [Deltaproteobacteria bacterium]|nr:TVP38/TMEM64 family protein [Deltaproteobacteria bacterium]
MEKLRPFIALGVVGVVFVAARMGGFLDEANADGVRARVEAAGAWGYVVYLALFCASQFVQVPGLIFVATAFLLWGPVTGFILAFGGALVALTAGFWFFRAIGGRAARHIEWPLVKRMLARLDARPVASVALLRLITLLAPPVTYALALSDVRFRDYLLGTLLGLLPPVLAAAFLFDVIV